MELTSKFLFFREKLIFEASKDSIPVGLNPIVFIEDSEEIYTCGKYFSFSSPDLQVSENEGSVNLLIGKESVKFSTTGNGISIRKGMGDLIIINSTALTSIKTGNNLSWDQTLKILSHNLSAADAGFYGAANLIPNASIFPVPFYAIDDSGHIVLAGTYNVLIRDFVLQLKPTTDNINRNILLSYEEASDSTEEKLVRKANGLTYNDFTETLSVPGGINVEKGNINVIKGDVVILEGSLKGKVEGEFTGTAVPKIHLSELPEYGGASLNTYGHVVLVDELVGTPAPSSNNTDTNNPNIVAQAASPYLVHIETDKVKKIIENKPSISSISTNKGILIVDTPNKNINFTGSRGITTEVIGDTITINGVEIKAYDQSDTMKNISTLNFTKDFNVDFNNNLSLSWEIIE